MISCYYSIFLWMEEKGWELSVIRSCLKKLIDLDMTNNELMEKANISKSTFYKINNGQNVTTDVLLRICNALDYDIEEIVEINEIKEDL